MADTLTSADPSLLQSLKQHLEGLKRTEHGLILYNQIQRGLKSYGDKDGRIELVFVSFLHALLGKYATSPACDAATRVKARLIQQRLTLYLPDPPVAGVVAPTPTTRTPAPTIHDPLVPDRKPELPTPSPIVETISPPPVTPANPEAARMHEPRQPEEPKPLAPLLPKVETPSAPVAAVTDTEDVGPEFLEPPPGVSEPMAPPLIVVPPPAPQTVAAVTDEKTSSPPAEVTPIPPVEQSEPVTRQEHIEALGDTLAEKMTESIAVDKQFGELLENERATLENMDSPLGEFNDMKQILVKGLNELIEERKALIEKLSSAGEYLKAVESDRERLRQELGKARKSGMTDDLTGLPNRDVFVRQLESEIGRVKRYGFSLALAVIGVDNLEAVNKRYGRSAGDAVLRCYAGEILSKFRTYDLVARYSDDGFAVLFPNTQKDGAMHALEKARKTATSTFIHHEGKNIPLPSFSSVLTQYAAGEPAVGLLKRADDTLIQAKQGGFNRMVVALPTS